MAPKSFASRFDGWSYKRVKDSLVSELVEPSSLGALLTLVGGLVLVVLFLIETLAFLSVTLKTETIMAPDAVGPLRVTFNVSFPRLPCNLLNLHVVDVLGRTNHNVTKNIVKFKIDGETGRKLMLVSDGRPAAQYEDLEGDFRPEGEGQLADGSAGATLLTADTFQPFITRFEYVLVAYGAPVSRRTQRVLFTSAPALVLCRKRALALLPIQPRQSVGCNQYHQRDLRHQHGLTASSILKFRVFLCTHHQSYPPPNLSHRLSMRSPWLAGIAVVPLEPPPGPRAG